MRTEKRALSWQEFLASGYHDLDYQYPDFEGTFAATMVCKRWGKRNCLFVYLDLADGRKILTAAWSDKGYLGLAEMPIGSRITVAFIRSSTGRVNLRSVEPLSEGGDAVISEQASCLCSHKHISPGARPLEPPIYYLKEQRGVTHEKTQYPNPVLAQSKGSRNTG